MKKIITILTFSFLVANIFAQEKTGLHIIQTFSIASPGGWDYIEVSPVHDWLYVSHGTQVNILNKNTGDSVGVIPNTTGVHGMAFDLADKKGFTSNGRLNSVSVFDIHTNKVLSQITTGQNPDAIIYEPYSKKVITCNGRSKNLSIIDPINDKLIDSVEVGGKPETAVSNGSGKLFVNVEDKSEIVVVDMTTFKVLEHWSILPSQEPTGLAYDKKYNRLFAGCDKQLVIIDAATGKVVDSKPIGDGCDGVVFDESSKNIFTSNGEGTISVIHQKDANTYSLLENIESKKGARTIALDKSTHHLFLPTADFEPMEANQKGRPKMKPGTFQILVVGK